MSPAGVRLGDLAERFSLELRGDAEARIAGVATLARAQSNQLSFLANPAYRSALGASGAGAIVLRDADAAAWHGNALVARDPYVAYARIAAVFEVRPEHPPGVHPSAVIDPAAHVAEGAHVGALACVGPRSRVEAGAVVGPGCVIGEDCIVGAGSELVARVTLVRRVRLGRRVLIHPGAVLGADGFGIANDGGTWIKVPQLGGVVIGDDCEIGANTTIDRGALDDTTLHEDVRLDNQIQIGHNVIIGAHTALAGCVAVAGSTTIGRHCLIGGAAGIAGHLQIADRVMVTAMTFVSASITAAGEYSSAIPAQDSKTWRRNAARLRRLDGFVRAQRRGGDDD